MLNQDNLSAIVFKFFPEEIDPDHLWENYKVTINGYLNHDGVKYNVNYWAFGDQFPLIDDRFEPRTQILGSVWQKNPRTFKSYKEAYLFLENRTVTVSSEITTVPRW